MSGKRYGLGAVVPDVDTEVKQGSTNPVSGGAVFSALQNAGGGGSGGGGSGTVRSVNNVQPDVNGNVTLSIPETPIYLTASEIDAMWGNIDGLPDGDEVSY